MKLHRNAKTTPHMRALLVERVRSQQWRPEAAAAAAGVSRRTAYKWLRRHRLGGLAALANGSSRPQRQPRRTPSDRVAAVVAARYERQTAWAIAVRLQIPRSTVAVILARAGLNRLARLTPPEPVVRYERARPGERVHIDIKPLARIVRVGHRIYGDRSTRVYGAGWEYVPVAVDDFSRVAYAEVLHDQRARSAIGFLRRTARWFAQRGVRIGRVLTDNGSSFRSHVFQAQAARHAIRLSKTRFHRPQTNGKAERFIQTLLREWAYVTAYPTSARRTRQLRPWIRHYNTARVHTALGYQPPCSRFPSSTQ